MKNIIKALFIFLHIIYAQSPDGVCGTGPMPPDQVLDIKRSIEEGASSSSRDSSSVHILVAWHVVIADNGAGDYSNQAIYDCIQNLNDAYLEHNIFFTLDTIDRTVNDTWFNNWYDDHSAGMQALSYDPYHYLNIYTADLLSAGVQGFAYLGNQYGASHYRQSVSLDLSLIHISEPTRPY